MGRTALCHGELGTEAGEIKAMLESERIQLRGPIRADLPLATLRAVRVDGEMLRARTDAGELMLALGAREAALWLKKIVSPPTLADKLGLSADVAIHVIDDRAEAMAALSSMPGRRVALEEASLVFALFDSREALDAFPAIAQRMRHQAHLWAIRPKGPLSAVKEPELMSVLRGLGFRPNKTAAWSSSHAADRYRR